MKQLVTPEQLRVEDNEWQVIQVTTPPSSTKQYDKTLSYSYGHYLQNASRRVHNEILYSA